MGERTAIAWCHHTMNAWIGCEKVSAGCANCYAEAFDKRIGGDHWGRGKPRRVLSDAYWREPIKWNRAAEKAGERRRVFSSSLADVLDPEAPEGQRERLFNLIGETPWLDWLLLTKRPENGRRLIPPTPYCGPRPNVWLGVTVEHPDTLWRVRELAQLPAAVRFVSAEPLLAETSFLPYLREGGVSWIIVGGESGAGARPFALDWARAIVRECQQTGTAAFVKQLGARPVVYDGAAMPRPMRLEDRQGGRNPDEWPEDLRIRQFPEPHSGAPGARPQASVL